MGKAIFYCHKCSARLREDDFDRGKAVMVENHAACIGCAPPGTPSPAPRAARGAPSGAAQPRLTASAAVPTARLPKAPSRALWVIAGGAVILVLILAGVFLSRSGSPTPEGGSSTTQAPPAVVDPPRPIPPPRIENTAARKALDAAREWAKAHPEDLSGQIREYTSVALQFDRSPEGREAQAETDRIKAVVKSLVASALNELDRDVRPFVERGDLAGALRTLEAAEKRLPLAEWGVALKSRSSEVREKLLRTSLSNNGLEAYWSFDEGAGQVAKDSSGHGRDATFQGAAAWAEGKVRGGVRFDGENSWLELKRDAVMDTIQQRDYTLALWFKPEGTPPGTGDQNTQAYGLLMKPGFHLGLGFNHDNRFFAHHWLQSKTDVGVTSDRPFPPGQFYHVAFTVSPSTGSSALYVDGVSVGSRSWEAHAPVFEYYGNVWRLGYAAPGMKVYAWPAKGILDEARIYSRALSDAEVRCLYELAR
jgi:hypothetical protein